MRCKHRVLQPHLWPCIHLPKLRVSFSSAGIAMFTEHEAHNMDDLELSSSSGGLWTPHAYRSGRWTLACPFSTVDLPWQIPINGI